MDCIVIYSVWLCLVVMCRAFQGRGGIPSDSLAHVEYLAEVDWSTRRRSAIDNHANAIDRILVQLRVCSDCMWVMSYFLKGHSDVDCNCTIFLLVQSVAPHIFSLLCRAERFNS